METERETMKRFVAMGALANCPIFTVASMESVAGDIGYNEGHHGTRCLFSRSPILDLVNTYTAAIYAEVS